MQADVSTQLKPISSSKQLQGVERAWSGGILDVGDNVVGVLVAGVDIVDVAGVDVGDRVVDVGGVAVVVHNIVDIVDIIDVGDTCVLIQSHAGHEVQRHGSIP